MSLFERYLAEVGRRLPRERREDILSELHSLLEDAFEARGGSQGDTESDEDLAAEVLVEFGPPGQIATAYLPGKRYLIGPRYFASFVTTMQICFWVILAIVGTGLLFDLFGGIDSLVDLARTVGASFNDLISSILSLLGMVVLIFALIERATPDAENRTKADWDPRTLPQPKDTRRIDIPGTVVGMALAVVALVVFNLLPDKVCIHFDFGAGNYTVPMLGPAFASQLPWLNAYLLLGLGLGILTIRHGRWERGLRLADFLIHLLLVFFFYQLATGAMVVELGADWLVSHGVPAEHAADLAEDVSPILATILRIAFWVALAAVGFSGLFKLKAFLTGDRTVGPGTVS
ncbi:MAG: hypothetical protein ABIF77_21790 [bacterium]